MAASVSTGLVSTLDVGSMTSTFSTKSCVEENVWARETTEDGRAYFYNRATGASQWHVPNDLYKPKCLETMPDDRLHSQSDCIRMPGSSRAVYGIDCMTEVLGGSSPAKPDGAEACVDGQIDGSEAPALSDGLPSPDVSEELLAVISTPKTMLRLTVLSARGLRDTDFMSSKDKSDPYCTVEIEGKDWTRVRGPTVFDCLDPEWNFKSVMRDYEDVDSIVVRVLDHDRAATTLKNSSSLSCTKSSADVFNPTDDILGSVCLSPEEIGRQAEAPRELRLDGAGNDAVAFVTVQARLERGYPELEGKPIDDVLRAFRRAWTVEGNEGASAVGVEAPDEDGCVVTSFDSIFKQGGYGGAFFGAFSDSARKLRPGSVVELAGQQYTIADLGAESEDQRVAGRAARYVNLTEPIRNGPVHDGARWRRIAQRVDGHDPERVVLVFDPATGLVDGAPVFG